MNMVTFVSRPPKALVSTLVPSLDTCQHLTFCLHRQSEVLITCTEELIPCAGQEIVKDYVVSARPHHCQDTSAAARVLATLSLLLVSLMLSLGLTKL